MLGGVYRATVKKFHVATLYILTGCNVEHEARCLSELKKLAAASKVR